MINKGLHIAYFSHKFKVKKALIDIFDVLTTSATFFRPVLGR